MRVAHLTSVHRRYDTRIFLKECVSLKNNGYDTSFIVADGKGDENKKDISIVDVGKPNGRRERILNTTKKVYEKAIEIDADVYHLHDPELIPMGLKLKKEGRKVVFDAHEDLPKQLLGKPYLNRYSRFAVSKMSSLYENWACPKFDGVVAATPSIRDKFLRINGNTIDVNNYPILDELATEVIDWSLKNKNLAYIGGISAIRGIKEVVQALELISSDGRLQLGGIFSEVAVEIWCQQQLGWNQVDPLGFVDREQVRNTLAQSVAGLVTFLPMPNHIDAQPNKMFEYMSAGIPVVASNFPLWKKVIEGNNCGLCVNPLDPKAIAQAVDYLIRNPHKAEEMGRNGQRAVYERYNWSFEEKKLLQFYESL